MKDLHLFQDAIIKECFWNGAAVNCSAVFAATPTDTGMCCSFNLRSALKDGTYRLAPHIYHFVPRKIFCASPRRGCVATLCDSLPVGPHEGCLPRCP